MKTKLFFISMLLIWVICPQVNAQYNKSPKVRVAGNKDHSYGKDSAHLSGGINFFVDNGNIFISDAGNNRVLEWASGATFGKVVAGNKHDSAGADSAFLSNPTDVTSDAYGNLYICDASNHRIQKWSSGAKYGVTVAGQKDGVSGTDSAHLYSPYGVRVDKKGNVYVSDQWNNRVQKWAPGAKYGVTVAGQKDGKSGTDSAHLHHPANICIDTSGNLFVLDYENNRIQKWAPGAKYGVTVAGHKDCSSGIDSTSLVQVYGFNMDAAGNIYIADNGNARIQMWAPHAKYGKTLLRVNLLKYYDCDSNWINGPLTVFVDNEGNLYEADIMCYNIYKWAKSGSGVNETGNIPVGFKVFPNPSDGTFTIDMSTPGTTGEAYVDMINLLGQNAYTRSIDNINGHIHATITDVQLAAGMYLVKVVVGEKSYTTRMVVQR